MNPCRTCQHPSRARIDDELLGVVAGITTLADVARRWDVDDSSLARHRDNHLGQPALGEGVSHDDLGGGDYLDELDRLAGRLLEMLDAVDDPKLAVSLAGSIQRTTMARAKLSGLLDRRCPPPPPCPPVTASPEWATLVRTVLGALDRHPGARADVLAALAAVDEEVTAGV